MSQQGVLLVNLGSPDSTSVPDVRKYLREFLMDGRVLDVAWPVRFGVVNFAILPSRPKESAHAYQKIWTAAGSPLVATSAAMYSGASKYGGWISTLIWGVQRAASSFTRTAAVSKLDIAKCGNSGMTSSCVTCRSASFLNALKMDGFW